MWAGSTLIKTQNKDACACSAMTQCGTVCVQLVQLCVILKSEHMITPVENTRVVNVCLSFLAVPYAVSLVSSL